jgi:hypothetical protein
MATKSEIRNYFAKFGKEGGKKRARNMTAEQRREAARKAVKARWAKADKLIKQMKNAEKEAFAELERKPKTPKKKG